MIMARDYDVFVENSELTLDQAKEFIDEHHYRTPITTDKDSWVDPETGRVQLFEAPREPSRLV
jgi:hypothetical protein